MDFRLLGEFQAIHDEAVLELGGRRRQAVLAVLLLNAGRTVSRQQIAEWAWPGDPPDSSGNLIANYVSGLRQALRPAGHQIRLSARPPGFAAELDRALIDVHRFGDLVRAARNDLDGNEPQTAAARLRQALDLWRGNALDGLNTGYLDQRRSELEAARRTATVLLARVHLDARQPDLAVELLHEVVAAEPGSEPSAVLLIQALTAAGDGAAAAELAAGTVRALRREGREPGPALRRAHSDALAGRISMDGGGTGSGLPTGRADRRLQQLPLDTGAFTGREHELTALLGLAGSAGPDGPPGTVVISAIDGMGGIGKTALAVHAAHILAERFPDGQLFVDLQGAHEHAPREPGDVLAEFLQAHGIAPQAIPTETAARAAAFRDRLAGTRTLLLLDNAGSEDQVRPLLPGTGGCLVLVTSRQRLKGLDDAHPVSLDVLSTTDAIALFRSIVTPGRVPVGDPLLEEIVTLCGHLPLALRITAALLRNRHTWTLQHLAARLQAGRDLTAFFDGDRDLTSVFNLSYRALDRDHQRLFRYLGLVPGSNVDTYATAALLDTDLENADRLLHDLVDHSLLTETAPDRFRMHDLLRLHARSQAAAVDSAEQRETALDRLLHYYAHTAQAASGAIARSPRPAPDGPAPTHAPDLTDPETARAWLRTESADLDAAFTHAHAHDLHGHTIALAAGVADILHTDGPWPRALDLHLIAAETARRTGRPAAQATALTDLGRVRYLTGDYPGAGEAHTRALELRRALGDRDGEAIALTDLGRVQYLTADYPEACDTLAQALEIYRTLGNRGGEVGALTDLGRVRHQIGDYPGAGDDFTEALGIYRALGDRNGEADVLTDLGRVRQITGDYPAAGDDFTEALEIYRALGDRNGEAGALTDLGRVRHVTGDHAGAGDAFTEGLEIYRALGNLSGEASALTDLGRVRQAAGDHPGADEALNRALEIFRETGERGNEAWALNHHAAAIAAAGDRPRAFAVYQRALAMNRELNKPDDEAISLEGIAEHYLAAGDGAQGTVYLRQALKIYQGLGMNPDAERTSTRLASVAGPEG